MHRGRHPSAFGAVVRHGAAEAIGIGIGEAGKVVGNLQHLLLKDDDAKGIAQAVLQAGMRIGDRLSAEPALDVGVDHAALEGSWAKERDLDDEVAKGTGLGAGEQRPLARALDLEDTDGL